MPDHPTLTTIAAAIRRHSPGAVPDSIRLLNGTTLVRDNAWGGHTVVHDDIARHVLIAAMTLALPFLVRDERNGAMCWGIDDPKDGVRTWFADSDHNNDPLLSLYSAWKCVKGIADA